MSSEQLITDPQIRHKEALRQQQEAESAYRDDPSADRKAVMLEKRALVNRYRPSIKRHTKPD